MGYVPRLAKVVVSELARKLSRVVGAAPALLRLGLRAVSIAQGLGLYLSEGLSCRSRCEEGLFISRLLWDL